MKRITPDQRRKLFALAREQGRTTDDLRDMTPAGSISMLTVIEAAALIDALSQGKRPDYLRAPRVPRTPRKRRPKTVYALISQEQRDMLLALRIDLGWSEEGLAGWLARRHLPDRRPMTEMLTAGDAVHVIELLKAVRARTAAARKTTPRAEAPIGTTGDRAG